MSANLREDTRACKTPPPRRAGEAPSSLLGPLVPQAPPRELAEVGAADLPPATLKYLRALLRGRDRAAEEHRGDHGWWVGDLAADARSAGISYSTARAALRRLRDLGFVRVIRCVIRRWRPQHGVEVNALERSWYWVPGELRRVRSGVAPFLHAALIKAHRSGGEPVRPQPPGDPSSGADEALRAILQDPTWDPPRVRRFLNGRAGFGIKSYPSNLGSQREREDSLFSSRRESAGSPVFPAYPAKPGQRSERDPSGPPSHGSASDLDDQLAADLRGHDGPPLALQRDRARLPPRDFTPRPGVSLPMPAKRIPDRVRLHDHDSPEERARLLVCAYRKAVREVYDQDYRGFLALDKVGSDLLDKLIKAADATLDAGVAPDAWAAWRLRYCRDKKRMTKPLPLLAVFAPKFVARAAGWFRKEVAVERPFNRPEDFTPEMLAPVYRARESDNIMRGVWRWLGCAEWYAKMREEEISLGFDHPWAGATVSSDPGIRPRLSPALQRRAREARDAQIVKDHL